MNFNCAHAQHFWQLRSERHSTKPLKFIKYPKRKCGLIRNFCGECDKSWFWKSCIVWKLTTYIKSNFSKTSAQRPVKTFVNLRWMIPWNIFMISQFSLTFMSFDKREKRWFRFHNLVLFFLPSFDVQWPLKVKLEYKIYPVRHIFTAT